MENFIFCECHILQLFQSYEETPVWYKNLLESSLFIWVNQQLHSAAKFIKSISC